MKNRFVHLLLICILAAQFSFAQDDPGSYMNAIANAHVEMNQKYMSYTSAVAHGRRAKKVEKLRQAALTSITNSKFKTIDLPKYKGDNSLRQSSIDYIGLCYNVFNEDYNKIVNMEEIAERSIDQMEAYILLQEKTSEKLKEANEKIAKATKEFAEKYNVKLVDSKDELSEKMEKANKVTHYQNQVYMLFFKCNYQDNQMVMFMNEKKVNDIEQARTALLKYATEGLAALETLKNFEGDPQLAISCRQLLNFYKTSAETNVPKMLDYYLKQDSFEKLKKAFDGKSTHTKEEVDAYNVGVRDINNAMNQFNTLNQNANNNRTRLVEQFEATEKAFADAHMPYYK